MNLIRLVIDFGQVLALNPLGLRAMARMHPDRCGLDPRHHTCSQNYPDS
jgi:hypothetical protein